MTKAALQLRSGRPSLCDVSPPPSVSGDGIYNKRIMIRLCRWDWGLCKQLSTQIFWEQTPWPISDARDRVSLPVSRLADSRPMTSCHQASDQSQPGPVSPVSPVPGLSANGSAASEDGSISGSWHQMMGTLGLATQGCIVTITLANVEIARLLKHTSQTGLHEPV